MGHSRIRLRDIAEKAGFSANTVSLALRNSPRIPEKTRKQIQDLATELNYRPNRIAQSLVSQKSMIIGLVLTDIRNPILTLVAQEVSTLLAEEGYATMFSTSSNTLEKEELAIDTLRERQVDGILIYPTDHGETAHLRELRDMGYPLVSLSSDPTKQLDTVSVDEQNGAFRATEHLIACGRRKIALLDAASPLGNSEKLCGYKQALMDAGIPFDKRLTFDVAGHGVQEGLDAMSHLWESGVRPDAVLATNDSLALGVQSWCQRNDISIPEDMAVAGFDNIELARLSSVPITTIAYPVNRVSRFAVSTLLSLINEQEKMPEPVSRTFEPDLLIRQSTSG